MTIEQLILAYFDAFNRHDIEGMLSTLSDDVAHDINEGEREVGKDAFRKFKLHMDVCYSEQCVDLVVMTNGNRGAAEFVIEGTYQATDAGLPPAISQEYSIPCAAFFEERGGLICRVTSYYNLKKWIEAVTV